MHGITFICTSWSGIAKNSLASNHHYYEEPKNSDDRGDGARGLQAQHCRQQKDVVGQGGKVQRDGYPAMRAQRQGCQTQEGRGEIDQSAHAHHVPPKQHRQRNLAMPPKEKKGADGHCKPEPLAGLTLLSCGRFHRASLRPRIG